VIGRASKARYLNESTVQLSAPAGKGKFTILIASAASMKTDDDVAAMARSELQAATAKGFEEISKETQSWWHDFWSRGFVHMHSDDKQADFVEGNYTYFLYIMGASSRGAYPPRFGGMLWYTNGDMRRWGSQYWFANTNAYYSNLMPANRVELMDPMFNLYSGMLDACALAAKQQWGSAGVWIPEINFFNGPEKLPDDIAAELQDLVLARKPYDEHSAKFQWWAETKNRHNSRWNFLNDGHFEHGHFVVPTKGAESSATARTSCPSRRGWAICISSDISSRRTRRGCATERIRSCAGRRSSTGISPTLKRKPTASITSITSTTTRAAGTHPIRRWRSLACGRRLRMRSGSRRSSTSIQT
jgi:hypothetical protein